jgi:hypothetical protein
MISMRRISMPAPIPQPSHRDHRISASSRMDKLRQRKGRQLVVGSFHALQQGPSSENSRRQPFVRA